MLPSSDSKKTDASKSKCDYDKQALLIKLKSETGDEEFVYYSAFYESIPEEYLHILERELNEMPQNTAKGIEKLKEMLLREGMACPNEDLIVAVLRGCKYNIKKSESKLRKFLKLRQENVKNMAKMDEKTIENIVDSILFGVLPYRDKNGRIILITQPTYDFELYTFEETLHCFFAFLMFLLTSPMTTVCGFSWICDSKCDSPWTYFGIVKNSWRFFKDILFSLSARFRRTDFINEINIIRWLFNFLLSILPQKMVGRVFFHGSNTESLCKAFHPAIFPSNFGGRLGPISNACYRQKFLDFIQELKTEHPEKNYASKTE